MGHRLIGGGACLFNVNLTMPAPEVVEMEILDTGATTGVPPRCLDTRQSFPDPVPEDISLRRQWLSRGVGPAHLQHGA
jgi:hypothetical protein